VLQELDLAAERRLRHAEPRGGAAEMAFLRDGEEMRHAAEDAEVHRR
jgi:hypothetical protein